MYHLLLLDLPPSARTSNISMYETLDQSPNLSAPKGLEEPSPATGVTLGAACPSESRQQPHLALAHRRELLSWAEELPISDLNSLEAQK